MLGSGWTRGLLGVLALSAAGGCMKRELKELSPCLVSNVSVTVEATGVEQVDILFVVDSSYSMQAEQEKLADQIPRLVETLASGTRADGTEFPAAKDMHLAVVTTDMGVPTLQYQDTPQTKCTTWGQDGLLQAAPAPAYIDPSGDPNRNWAPTAACSSGSFPSYVEYRDGGPLSPTEAAQQLGCLAQVGPGGCGFEMQLEAPLKALWPSTDPTYQFLGGTPGHGDLENRGFLRENSLLAVILVTDEDDCSVENADHLHLPPLPGSRYEQDKVAPNFLCTHYQENLRSVQRYVDGLRALRPGNEDRVIFTAITGVPQDLVSPEALANYERDDPKSRAALYARIRNAPEMVNQPDPNSPNTLKASCTALDGAGSATPPLRILDVVEGFGENGIIQSICQKDFGPAIDSIIEVISDRLGNVCLPRELVRNAQGEVDCNVVWTLPKPGSVDAAGAPTRCEELDYLSTPDTALTSLDGRIRCKVEQLSVMPGNVVEAGLGWYYDDFSPERELCRGAEKQRVAFSANAEPPAGVSVKLECLNEVQSLPQTRTDIAYARYGGQGQPEKAPTIGTRCDGDDSLCQVFLSNGEIDTGLFCHPEFNVCVQPCNSDADCPDAWVCDARQETLMETQSPAWPTGAAICVNPTCGES